MLKGLDPLLSPDLLHLLARMGHGDDLAIVDINHPAETVARATTSGVLVRLPGIAVERAVEAVLSLFPLDDFTEDPVRVMQVVDEADETPPAMAAIIHAVRHSGHAGKIERLERFEFYEAAKASFGVIQCGDPRFYGNVLLRMGAIAGK
jgi:L-fucose mutarotase